MASVNCQTFSQNAWRPDLCANCFRTQSEHGPTSESAKHPPLAGQDSLTELQQGTNRYVTLASNPFTPTSRNVRQISKWNDIVFQDSRVNSKTSSSDSCQDSFNSSNGSQNAAAGIENQSYPQLNSKLQDTLDSLNTIDKVGRNERKTSLDQTHETSAETEAVKEDTMASSPTVIERLDSLVMGTPLSSMDESPRPEDPSPGKAGILKDSRRSTSAEKKRSITFPDYEELQEIIGYGGECYYSSDEDEEEPQDGGKSDNNESSEELSQEERNMINITKKNTTFNSHAQNLMRETPSAPVKLGQEKKHTPVISVRPFVREQTPGKVNMVSPMINGELVVKTKTEPPPAAPTSTKSAGRDNGIIARKLSHDDSGRGEVKNMKKDRLGSDGSTENSSDSDSNMRDSPPPIPITSFASKKRESVEVESITSKTDLEKSWRPRLGENHVSRLSLSLPSVVSSQPVDKTKKSDSTGSNVVRKGSVGLSARSSFLNETIKGGVGGNHVNSAGTSVNTEKAPGGHQEDSEQEVKDTPDSTTVPAHEDSLPSQVRVREAGDLPDHEDAPRSHGHAEPKANHQSTTAAASVKKIDSVISSPRESPKVKLTRKSPYVVGPYASTAILKGTPKPMITRKPPILKDKPKVPLKPNKLILRSPSSSPSARIPGRQSSPEPATEPTTPELKQNQVKKTGSTNLARKGPVAAPRTASFRQKSGEVNLSVGEETTTFVGAESEKQELVTTTPTESISQTSLVIAVSSSSSEAKRSPSLISSASGSRPKENPRENSPPRVQKKLADKNKEALEAIRKSLSNKLISSSPPPLVVESIKASNSGADFLINKPQLEKTVSNSFEETRAALEETLHFSRHEKVNTNPAIIKRQAPQPPPEPEDPGTGKSLPENETLDEEPLGRDELAEGDAKKSDLETEIQTTPKLTPAIRNSSMKSEISSKTRDNKTRTVQFSPDTQTVTVPAVDRTPKMISYNRWMGKNPNPYLESSFTGQPIAMLPPGAITPAMKKPMVTYPTPPVIDDVPRKWTEKKKKWRSKSTPRSSEIDELMGSSKTKTPNRLAIFSPASPGPVRRQSRVEIYESEKRTQKKGKFSLKNLFRNPPEMMNENLPNKYIDKEHEREILERQKAKARPEIIHPLDLLNGGVEVVKITPKNSLKGQFDKAKLSVSSSKSTVIRTGELKTKIDVEGKDSGHDTSSIHTETSEDTGTSSGSGDFSNGSTDFSTNLSPIGMVQQPDVDDLNTHHISSTILGLNSAGKPKPPPPPRSQSLEAFDKQEQLDSDADQPVTTASCDSVYANLGTHHRSGLVPSKPQRTGSMREEADKSIPAPPPPPPSIVTQSINPYILPGKMSLGDVSVPSPNTLLHPAYHHVKTSSVTESLNSETMSDSSLSSRTRKNGSEADSERDSVSPQRIQDEKLLAEDGSPVTSTRKRLSSIRRGRSIVHKNLEDNYGAVISANHEALAQILEQVCENRPIPPSLRPLSAAINLRFGDFSVLSESEGLRTARRAFYPATWGSSHLPVTLMVSRDMSLNGSQVNSSFSLDPVAQFVDQVPTYLLSSSPTPGIASSQGVVWALTRTNIINLSSFSKGLQQRRKSLRMDDLEKEMSFVLLQLINGLKYLQAQGTEEVRAELDRFLLARRENDANYRLIITEEVHAVGGGGGQDRRMSLCECALASMLLMFDLDNPVEKACTKRESIELPQLLPSVSMYKTMATILQKDGSVALGQVKSMLEYMLWGPSDIIFELNQDLEAESREASLQRWLDLERATVLNNMIRSQGIGNIQLTVYQEYHLLFLVRTCAKMLREASLLFESEVSRM